MDGINLQRNIAANRRAKKHTQDDLAAFLGVTKASVSKWETGISYPDITLLPRLAAYFDISIDDLIGYEPQMHDDDIRKLYKELALNFTTKPYQEVMNQCREIVKKYYSCFNLLLQMGILYINYGYYTLNLPEDEKLLIVNEAKGLFIRIRNESDDADLRNHTLVLLATCDLLLGNPDAVINMYKDIKKRNSTGNEIILAQAYLMSGKPIEAKTELQNGIYNAIMNIICILSTYMEIFTDDEVHFHEMVKRASTMIELWNIEKLAPIIVIPFYYHTAAGYVAMGLSDKALDMLENCTNLCEKLFPISLLNDDFFNLITLVNEEPTYGSAEIPRDDKSIKQGLVEGFANNPALIPLHKDLRFINMVNRLKQI